MVDILDTLGIKKKNSIDEFVEGVQTSAEGVAQNVKDYAGKVTKPVTDFVTEIGESRTYAHAKDKAAGLADGVKNAIGYAQAVPPTPSLGEKVAYAVKDIAEQISDASPFKKKNSVDEFVEGVQTTAQGAAQDAKDYAGKATKPVTDFVTEVKESKAYANLTEPAKDK